MKGRIVRPKRSVDFVGRDVQEAKLRALRLGQSVPIGARFLQQEKVPLTLVRMKSSGPMDGAIDVALGGKVNDGSRAVLCKQAAHEGAVADIAMNEDVSAACR